MTPLNPSFPSRYDWTPISTFAFFGSFSLPMKALVLSSMSPSQFLETIFQGSFFGRTPSGEGEMKPLY